MEESAPVAADPPEKPKKKKRPKRAVTSTVNVHDRTQIEAVFDYYLHRGLKKKRGDVIRYRVECFLFYPRQFGLDPSTYPKERFFADIRPLVRLREPRLGFKQMLGLKQGGYSPLTYLRHYVKELGQGRMPEPLTAAIAEVRIFACAFISNFLKNIDSKRIRYNGLVENPDAATPQEMELLLARTVRVLEKAHLLLLEFRQVLAEAMCLPPDIAAELKTEFRLIDEYCYYRLRDGAAYLLLISEDFRRDGAEELHSYTQALADIVAFHDEYAVKAGYLHITPDSPPSVRERFMHRRGELKRRIWSVLFLEVRTEPTFAFQRQVGAMVAAGLAALWAVLAQIILVRKVMMSESTVDFLGISGLMFLSAGVFAYVIKDRIKEIGRSYFKSRIFRRIPDHSERIYYKDGSGQRIAIGKMTEEARFDRIAELPASIRDVRERIAASGDGMDEAIDGVLRYTKVIALNRRFSILGRYRLKAVHDIVRLNVEAALPRLGEPTRILHIVDGEGTGEVHEVPFPKVYYLDMALTYQRLDAPEALEPQRSETMEYFRLVVDKNGLQRIERLS